MKEKNIKEKTQQKKKMGLTTRIFVALIAGAILGIILCYLAALYKLCIVLLFNFQSMLDAVRCMRKNAEHTLYIIPQFS